MQIHVVYKLACIRTLRANVCMCTCIGYAWGHMHAVYVIHVRTRLCIHVAHFHAHINIKHAHMHARIYIRKCMQTHARVRALMHTRIHSHNYIVMQQTCNIFAQAHTNTLPYISHCLSSCNALIYRINTNYLQPMSMHKHA